MTQETLAKLMFVSRPTVSRWEMDSVTPNAQALQWLSEVLGVRFVIGDAEAMQDQAQPSEDLGSASQVPKGESLASDDRRGALQVLEGESLASEAEPGVSGEEESLPEGGAEAAEAPASERRRPLRRRLALLACAVLLAAALCGTSGRFFRPDFRTIIRRVQAKIMVGKWDKRTVPLSLLTSSTAIPLTGKERDGGSFFSRPR